MKEILKNSVLLNSGRNCLRLIVKMYKIKQIKIPYYICPVIWQTLQEENIKIKFYHIDKNFMPSEEFKTDEYILYPNYFGICDKQSEILSSRYKNMIIDNAQAFFAKPLDLCCFYSPRKFFNVNDGGILNLSGNILSESLTKNFIQDTNRLGIITNYEEYLKNELSIDREPIKKMSEKTYTTLSEIDISQEQKRRKEIFIQIDKILSKRNVLKHNIKEFSSKAMFYPFLTENPEKYVNFLHKKGFYILRYWSKMPDNYTESIFYNKMLAIPLKQEILFSLYSLFKEI